MSALKWMGLVALTPASQSEGGTFLFTAAPPLGPSSQTSLETQASIPPTDFIMERDRQSHTLQDLLHTACEFVCNVSEHLLVPA